VTATRYPVRPVVGVAWTCPLLVSYVSDHGIYGNQTEWSHSVLESSDSPSAIVLAFGEDGRTFALMRPPSGGRSASRSITRDGPALAYGLADDDDATGGTAAVAAVAAGRRLFVGTTPPGRRARRLRVQTRAPSTPDNHHVLSVADIVGRTHELGLPLVMNFLAIASMDQTGGGGGGGGGGVTRRGTEDVGEGATGEKMVDLCDRHWAAKGGDGNQIAKAYRSMCEKMDGIPR
jgi:hypothetical protein